MAAAGNVAGDASRKLARTLRALAEVPSRVAGPLSTFITRDLQAKTGAGLDPYGRPLEPLRASTVRRKGHSRILYASGALQATERAQPLSKTGIGLFVDGAYPPFHITGTSRMVARPFFPINVMPAQWRAELRRLLESAFGKGLS